MTKLSRFDSVCICCNYIDDNIYSLRRLSYRNSAASKKLLQLSDSINHGPLVSSLLSMGRGTSKAKHYYFTSLLSKKGLSKIYVASYTSIPVLTHIISALSLLFHVHKLSSKRMIFLFYNYQIHYLPSVLYCRLFGLASYMIVDDDIPHFKSKRFSVLTILIIQNILLRVYDLLTSNKVITAYKTFRPGKVNKKVFTYYTSMEPLAPFPIKNYRNRKIRILFSGTLSKDSGLDIFSNLLLLLQNDPLLSSKIEFYITGSFQLDSSFSDFLNDPQLSIYLKHNMSLKDYSKLSKSCDIGLSLKLPNTIFGDLTFPSKVFDYASKGLAVISTDVSDVKSIFGDSFLFLENNQIPYENQLYAQIKYLASNSEVINQYISNARLAINAKFSTESISKRITRFLCFV